MNATGIRPYLVVRAIGAVPILIVGVKGITGFYNADIAWMLLLTALGLTVWFVSDRMRKKNTTWDRLRAFADRHTGGSESPAAEAVSGYGRFAVDHALLFSATVRSALIREHLLHTLQPGPGPSAQHFGLYLTENTDRRISVRFGSVAAPDLFTAVISLQDNASRASGRLDFVSAHSQNGVLVAGETIERLRRDIADAVRSLAPNAYLADTPVAGAIIRM